MPAPRPSLRVLFLEALDIEDAAQRAAYLNRSCGADTNLRRKLEELLALAAEAAEATSFGAGGRRSTEGSADGSTACSRQIPNAPGAEAPPALLLEGGWPAAPARETELETKPGDRIGRYQLLEKIGDGGFGVVYMAEQQEPVRRRVALKIIKPGLETRLVVARFEAERQALALMDHPNIAKVFDGGVTGSLGSAESQISNLESQIHSGGRPYFVMELVAGIPLTDYCDQHQLGLPQRLELFSKVCSAVQHAHQKGVIHRDLKPSNILVTINDGVAVPKVIDFGIAKATEQKLTDKTLFTQFAQFMGTPAYMSPEQTALTSLDIDTRSDIYSLGVLLYELLTGQPPFDSRDLLKIGLDELCRTLREVEPPRPSTRLSTLASDARAQLAKRCNTQPLKLVHLVRGDLDWIVMKCLEKDRSRRYETASALAADLRRHLNNEPVLARSPSAAYRWRKLIRRHRLAFLAGAAIALALIAGIAATSWMAFRAARQRDRAVSAESAADQRRQEAVEQAAVKQSVLDFLVDDLLRQADSREQLKLRADAAPQLTVKEALRRASDKVDTRFKHKPAEEQAVRNALGIAFIGIGEPRLAVAHLERSVALLRERLGPVAPETFSAMGRLAQAYNDAGQFKDAVALGQTLLQLSTNAPAAFVLAMRTQLASAYSNSGDLKKGTALAEEVWRANLAQHGSNDLRTLRSQLQLAGTHALSSRHREALTFYAGVRAQLPHQLATNSLEALKALMGLATAYGQLDQPAEALPLYQEAIETARRLLGDDHPETLQNMEGLARTYEQLGRRAESRALTEQVAHALEARLGPDHDRSLKSQARLAAAEFDSGQKTQGVARLERTLARQQAAPNLGPDHPDTLQSMSLLGRLYWSAGRQSDSTRILKDGWQRSRQSLGPAHKITRHLQWNLALDYLETGQMQEGGALFAETMRAEREQSPADVPEASKVIRMWVASYERDQRYALAATLQRVLVDDLRQGVSSNSLEFATENSRLGRHLLGQKEFAEAETVLHSTLAIFREKAPEHWRRFVTQALLGSALAGQQKFAQAESLLLDAHTRLHASASVSTTYQRDALARVARLYGAWNEFAPDPGRQAQAAQWKQKLADFDQTATKSKPAETAP